MTQRHGPLRGTVCRMRLAMPRTLSGGVATNRAIANDYLGSSVRDPSRDVMQVLGTVACNMRPYAR